MSFLHVVVPHEAPSCCAKRRFSTSFPHQLSAHMMPQEFEQSIQTINSAYNKLHAGPAFAYAGSWLLYVAALMMVIDPYMYTSNDYGYYDQTLNCFWIGWGLLVVAIIAMIASSRWIRNRRVNELNNSLAQANMVYNQRGLAWRVVNAAQRNMNIEITALAPIGQPIQQAQPVQQPTHYVNQPMTYAAPMPVNQALPQNHYQPYFAHPAPQVTSPSHHQQSINQPQYVHATPAYPTVYPVEHANAPLIQHY